MALSLEPLDDSPEPLDVTDSGPQQQYPPVLPDVAFSAVLALPAAQPFPVYRYGDALSQFVQLWLLEPATGLNWARTQLLPVLLEPLVVPAGIH
jgi:hypothetical protein